MSIFIDWATRIAIVGLFVLIGFNVWLAISSYQTMTTEEIQVAQQKEQLQRQQFEQQFQSGAFNEERPRKREKEEEDSPFHNLKDALKESGENAVPLVWLAVSFWLVVEVIKFFASKTSESVRKYMQKLVAFLRDHHRAIGWVAFGLSAVHSIYYLALWWFKSMAVESLLLWSGIVSFVAFLFLTAWGEWLQAHGRDKSARKVHWFMAMVMVIGMVVHSFESLGKILLVAGVFIILYFISQWFDKWRQSKMQIASE